MSKVGKTQRARGKRDAKRAKAKRRTSVSPVKRLAAGRGESECWISENFLLDGQMQVIVYKQAAGLTGVACFLVDRGIAGLKDAWTRMHASRAELRGLLELCDAQGLRMRRGTIDEARKWVTGAARWAHDNGMRLPKDWANAVSLLGGAGDWKSADVSGFVKEFAGHPEDLRQRLVGQSFEAFVERDDIEFIFSEDAVYLDQRTGQYQTASETGDGYADLESLAADVPVEELDAMIDRLTPATNALAAETADWLAMRGDTPSPELVEAWGAIVLASMLSRSAMPDGSDEDVAGFGYELLEGLAARIETSRLAEYDAAVRQALAHLEIDAALIQKAVLKHGLVGETREE